ncbi:riboflavin kinase [Streptomyces sp. 6N223]|uniref:riboflavin kinase n=1 Tax=Streptomyces sp. 6N223 TaxID=3457412 RepID=UPI003FD52052
MRKESNRVSANQATDVPTTSRRDRGFYVRGVVEHGDRRGRTLGFPTANIVVVEERIPDGVYASIVRVDSKRSDAGHVAAVSVGRRPTCYDSDGARLLEAHILDFRGDLYGHDIEIELRVCIRPQMKFASAKELVRQCRLDIDATRAWALTNGLEALLGTRPPGASATPDRPCGVRRRAKQQKNTQAAIYARAVARRELLAEEASRIDFADLTHRALAARTGIPLGYIQWHYPTEDDLVALRESWRPWRAPG